MKRQEVIEGLQECLDDASAWGDCPACKRQRAALKEAIRLFRVWTMMSPDLSAAVEVRRFSGDDWTMVDPTCEAAHRARWKARYGCPTRDDLMLLATMAEAYDYLVAHPCGTEAAIRRLREVRRQGAAK